MMLWGNWHSPFLLYSLLGMLWFGLLGFLDDYAKVKSGSGIAAFPNTANSCCRVCSALLLPAFLSAPMVRWGRNWQPNSSSLSINTLWQIWDFLRHSDFLFCAVCIECRQYH